MPGAKQRCRMWWTLTGNFGNMLPLDFNKSQVRAHQLPSLNLDDRYVSFPWQLANERLVSGQASTREGEDTDEELARAMDMHVMVGQGPSAHEQTAEQVIDEIDLIMQVWRPRQCHLLARVRACRWMTTRWSRWTACTPPSRVPLSRAFETRSSTPSSWRRAP